jgi:hypothetical protein
MLDNYFREYGLIAIFTMVAIGVPISMLMMSGRLKGPLTIP